MLSPLWGPYLLYSLGLASTPSGQTAFGSATEVVDFEIYKTKNAAPVHVKQNFTPAADSSAGVNKGSLYPGEESSNAGGSMNGGSSLGAEIIEPKLISVPKNRNRTDEARRAGYTGISKVRIQISDRGDVINAQVLNDLPYGLNERAIDYAKQLKFKPALLNNQPILVERELAINFSSRD